GPAPQARSPAADAPPIVFVHGDGDSAALWMTTIWRFESNGWPRERLHAVEFPYPTERDDDTKPQDGRSSVADQRLFLAAELDKVLAATGARKVVLYALSRGVNPTRSYLIDGGGADKVSHAILSAGLNHGGDADPPRNLSSEY